MHSRTRIIGAGKRDAGDDRILNLLIERERTRFWNETFQEFKNASEEKLLSLAMKQQQQGIIVVNPCPTCEKTVAFARESAKEGFACPFCGAPPCPT